MSSRNATLLAVAGLAFAASAGAAQTYNQPKIFLRAENNTNRDMTVGPHDGSVGYIAELQTTLGWLTPTSELTARPWVRFQNYDDNLGSNDVEGRLDLSGRHSTERSESWFYLLYDRRDTSHSEFGDPTLNDLGPRDQTSPETGRSTVGETRELIMFNPQLTYRATERVGVGVGGLYQRGNYSGRVNSSYVDYDYYRVEPFVRWQSTQRTDVTFGPVAGRYKATSRDFTTDELGGSLGLHTRWTQVWETGLNFAYERNKLDAPGTAIVDDTSNQWSATFSATRRGETGRTRFEFGRLLTPSGNGGVTTSDQIGVAYEENFTARTSLRVGVSYNHDKTVFQATTLGTNGDWKYAAANTEYTWRWTPRWFVSGGYEYRWQRYQGQSAGADNHIAFLSIGYEGLGPQY